MELRFEPCVLNLIWKRCKRPKKKEDHLIFINFGVKKFIVKNTPENKTLMFEWYNFTNPKDEELQFFEVDLQQGNFKII
jgi:hypothetical protein